MAKKVLRDTFSQGSAQKPQKRKVPSCREKKNDWNTVELFWKSEGALKKKHFEKKNYTKK